MRKIHFRPVFWASKSAATSIEYALIAGMIALAIVAAVDVVGQNLQKPYTDVAAGLEP
jgi:Flp pilus assembly pilin Flp